MGVQGGWLLRTPGRNACKAERTKLWSMKRRGGERGENIPRTDKTAGAEGEQGAGAWPGGLQWAGSRGARGNIKGTEGAGAGVEIAGLKRS